ncbi:MAG: tRNA lysidine(34) synthetase TilS [Candidatus Omnitrophota bacterium]
MAKKSSSLLATRRVRSAAIPKIRETFLETVQDHALISPGDRIVVGVSGGCDSVFLLVCLHELQRAYRLILTAAHYNHRLRGEASEEDERFVASLCERLGVPLRVGRWERHSPSEPSEDEARKARYGFFEQVCREAGANKLALGHTSDDDAETILFRFLRGSSLSGLRGIPYGRALGSCTIIRPLKDLSKEEIRNHLRAEKIAWREDASNQDLRYTRNRIRNQLLPLLEKEFNPNIRKLLVRLGKNMADDYDYLQKASEAAWGEVLLERSQSRLVLKRRLFQRLPVAIQKQIFREAMRKLGVDMDRIGYAEWQSVTLLLKEKSSRQSLPGCLEVSATPTKILFAASLYRKTHPGKALPQEADRLA